MMVTISAADCCAALLLESTCDGYVGIAYRTYLAMLFVTSTRYACRGVERRFGCTDIGSSVYRISYPACLTSQQSCDCFVYLAQ